MLRLYKEWLAIRVLFPPSVFETPGLGLGSILGAVGTLQVHEVTCLQDRQASASGTYHIWYISFLLLTRPT